MTEQSVLLQEKEKQKRYDAAAQLLEEEKPKGVTLWELRVLLVPCTTRAAVVFAATALLEYTC